MESGTLARTYTMRDVANKSNEVAKIISTT